MTHAILASTLAIWSLPSVASAAVEDSHHVYLSEVVEDEADIWLAFAQGELVRYGDLRIQLDVSGDGFHVDACWRF
jgi:hypothetical protein